MVSVPDCFDFLVDGVFSSEKLYVKEWSNQNAL
jgi:hypothetical protein